jgi:predicted DNA-binding protein with PD1-like motif
MTDIQEDLHINLQESMNVIITMLETINMRSLDTKKEVDKLKYLFELKKGKELTKTITAMTDEQKANYITKQKMYIGKLNSLEIKTPKDETLKYYNLKKEGETYKIIES